MQTFTEIKNEDAQLEQQAKELLPNHIQIREGVVYSSTNYAAFGFFPGNRDLDEKKIAAMMKSMDIKYLIAPILVNEELMVIDGQHRFEAARRKGREFNFIVKDGLREEDIPAYNSNASNWIFKDYAKAYTTDNRAEYVYLNAYSENHGITINQALHFLTGKKDFHGRASGGSAHKLRDNFTNDFEAGNFVVDRTFDPKGDKIAHFVQLRTFLQHNDYNYNTYKDNADFAKAFMTIVSHPDYIPEHMLSNIDKHWEVGKIKDAVKMLSTGFGSRRVNTFLIAFSEIYNFYNRSKVTIDFTKRVKN